jgi:hypothetical protein
MPEPWGPCNDSPESFNTILEYAGRASSSDGITAFLFFAMAS